MEEGAHESKKGLGSLNAALKLSSQVNSSPTCYPHKCGDSEDFINLQFWRLEVWNGSYWVKSRCWQSCLLEALGSICSCSCPVSARPCRTKRPIEKDWSKLGSPHGKETYHSNKHPHLMSSCLSSSCTWFMNCKTRRDKAICFRLLDTEFFLQAEMGKGSFFFFFFVVFFLFVFLFTATPVPCGRCSG